MLTKIFPFIDWFKGYNAAALRSDAISGLTVALVLIPQSMAYAQLAGMPAYYGLYASFLPPLIAALFGSSRQLATGPVAVVSLMTAASLEPLATAGSEGYIAYAILLALMVGLFQFLLGVLKLGLVVNFLSHPVVNGFTNAAAIIIASSQLSKMFGVYVDKAEHHYETIIRVVQGAIHYTHWPTLAMGAFAFAIMIVLKRINPKIPNVLVAVALTTAISWGIGFNHDTSASIDSIRIPEVQESVAKFNTTLMGIEDLSRERTALNLRLDTAKQAKDVVGELDMKHDLSVINIRIARLKHEAHLLRAGLRSLLMDGVEEAAGSMVFFRKGETPAGMTTDGRTWRIKVGNARLDTAGLKMIGGGAIVGSVPSGIPAISAPALDLKVMLHLLPFAAIISLLGFMEAISIAKAMAAKTGQRLDPNQELIGQGLANMLGACGKSYPASGSFSRSAVNLQAGAVTGMSSVFTSLMVVIVLLFFTPLLYNLPQAVLAAVIMMAVIGLINASGFVHAWKAQWYDGAISIISFLCTLAFAPHLDKGIMVGVSLSLLVFLYKSMRPRVASLSRTDDESLRDATAFGLKECRHISVVRFDGPLFFANASFLEDQITDRMMGNDKLRHIIIVANGINDMDASGEEALSLIVDRVRAAGVDISLCGVNESVMAVLERTHLLEKIGTDHVYPTMETAICATHESAHKDGQEENCPLTTVCRLAQRGVNKEYIMSVITVFNGLFSEAGVVVKRVLDATGYRLVTDQEIVADAAGISGMAEEKIARAFQAKASVFNTFSHDKERAIAWLRMAMAAKLVDQDKLLFSGFASQLASPDIDHILKVCLISTMRERLAVAERTEGYAEKHALKLIHKDDEDRAAWIASLKGVKDPWDRTLYDIVVPVGPVDVDKAADIIVEQLDNAAVRVTDVSKARAEDFLLAAKVETVLAAEGHSVLVSARQGKIKLTINKHVLMLERLERELSEIVSAVDGVQEVETGVGKGFHQTDIYRKVDFEMPSKVLLVDDEREFAQTLSERLMMRDMGSAVVFDGESALDLVSDDEPEVMVLDLKMPGIDGIEVLRRVKEEHPNIEVVILTGHGSEKDRDICMGLGAFAYLHKPVDIDVLSETLKAANDKIRSNK